MVRAPLTDFAIRGLAPERGTRMEIWDTKIPGLGVRASGHGTKTFVLMYRFGGRKRRFGLGRYPIVSLAGARERARDLLRQAANGVDPEGDATSPTDDTNFARVVDAFVERHCRQHNRASTARETERILRSDFVAQWDGRSIAEISSHDVRNVIRAIVEGGRPSAANHALAAVRKFFNWCVEQQRIETSPCAQVRRPAPTSSRERVLSDTDLAAIWRATGEMDSTFTDIVRLLITTAQRRGEVTGLRWSEINFDDGLWTIPGERTKNHTMHVVPLSKFAVDLLRSRPRLHTELAFPARGKDGMSFSGFSKQKRRLDEVSGVKDFTLHDLRRTAATGMARLGVAPHVVERILNHTSGTFGGVAGVYNRFAYIPEMRQALEIWAGHIFRLETSADKSS